MATKTLQELQAEQATIDASYSAAAEKWANGEFDPTDVVTLLERAETAESNAENSANVASTAAIRAENSADTAATAGAEAGTTAGTAAGTAAAQDVYDTVFTQEHTYTDTQNFSDITIQGEGPIAKEQAAWLMQNANTAYKADSYFTNLWADKQTDDIYIRRLYKYDYNTAPAISPLSDSLPDKVVLTLKNGNKRVYDNALATLFKSHGGDIASSSIVASTADACFDPVLEQTLIGFWERCNYYKDENGDTRIVAVRGEEGFDKRKPDVGTFGPAIWFDVRDSLDVDTSGNTRYTEVIVSTSPHPELGLHPHPLAMRHDGTVAPYWCCSAYPASRGLEYYSQPISVYNGYTELSASGAYNATNLTAEEIVSGCRARGKGYGDGSYIASLLQLMHIIKYGTKDSQSIMRGVCNNSYGNNINVPTASSITEVYSEFDVTKGHYWIPLELNTDNKNFLSRCNAVWIDGLIKIQGSNTGISKNSRPYMIISVDEYNGILRVWLETDYSIKYSFNTDNNLTQYKITAAKAVAGCTDNVYSKYDGPAMYSACLIADSNAATNGYQPFRLHGIEYGMQWETFMDKVWETPSGTTAMTEDGTQCYYRLPWENKYADTTSSPVHATTERYVSYGYGTDYSTKVIASNYADSGYDVVISAPVCVSTAGSSSTGLCDYYATPYAGDGLRAASGWGGPYVGSDAGLFACNCYSLDYGGWYSGARL